MNERINKKKVMYHFLNHVTEIVLNVKNLLTKLYCEGGKTVFIEATGPAK